MSVGVVKISACQPCFAPFLVREEQNPTVSAGLLSIATSYGLVGCLIQSVGIGGDRLSACSKHSPYCSGFRGTVSWCLDRVAALVVFGSEMDERFGVAA